MADYHLHLFGIPELRTAAGETVYFRTRKHFGLLVYLALEGRDRPVPRDRLIELFWPEAPYERARHSLSQGLTAIRGSLGADALSKGGRHIQLTCAIASDLDRPGGVGNDGGIDSPTPLDSLDDAGGAEFGHWLDRVRQRLVTAVRRAVSCELNELRESGDHKRVQERAAWLYRVDPKNEIAVQLLAEGALAEGDTEGAVRLWEEFCNGLDDPQRIDGTKQLVERIRATSQRPSADHVSAPGHRSAVFIGRNVELSRLRRLWDELPAAHVETCLLEGPPGIGKTALAKRLEAHAAASGQIAVRVQCHPIDAEIPFAALSSLINSLGRDPDLGATDPRWLSEASRFDPNLRRRFPGIPEPAQLPGEAVRLLISEAVARIVETLSNGLSSLIIIDDIHNLDPASRDVIHILSRRAPKSSIFIVGIQRVFDGANKTYLGAPAAELITWNRTIRIGALNSYDSQALIRELTQELTNQETYSRTVLALDDLADGHPYFIELLCNDWVSKGPNSLACLCVMDRSNAATSWSPSDAMKLAFAHHIRGLTPEARRVLEYLATLGKPADPRDIAELTGYSKAETHTILEGILSFGTLVPEGPRVAFKNEAHRAFIYHAASDHTRSFYHSQVARFLTASVPADTSRFFEAAHHYRLAGAHEDALALTILGAQDAVKHGGYREAEAALRASQAMSIVFPAKAASLLADCLNVQGRFREALSVLDSVDDQSGSSVFAARINTLRCEAIVRGCIGNWNQTREIVETTLDEVAEIPDEETRCRALLLAAEYCAASRDWNALSAVAAIALKMTPQGPDSPTNAYRDLVIAFCEASRGQYRSAIERFQASAEQLGVTGPRSALPRALSGVGCCAMLSGNFRWATDAFLQAQMQASDLGDFPFASNVLNNLAVLHVDLGRFKAAEQFFGNALKLNRIVPQDRYEAVILCNLADFELIRGNIDHATQLTNDAGDLIARSQPTTKHLQWLLTRADLAVARGDFPTMMDLISQAVHTIEGSTPVADPPASPWDPPHLTRSLLLARWLNGSPAADLDPPFCSEEASASLARLVETTLTYEWICEQDQKRPDCCIDGASLVRSTGLYGVACRLGTLGLLPQNAYQLFCDAVPEGAALAITESGTADRRRKEAQRFRQRRRIEPSPYGSVR
jgi:DNA-binding SARP family transcriptional activator/tetratricopeptide (TPR) repeat protein